MARNGWHFVWIIFWCQNINPWKKIENQDGSFCTSLLALFQRPCILRLTLYVAKFDKIKTKGNFNMPNDPPERPWSSGQKWRFFSIGPILASFYGQNPKMAISPERLDRFQKFLRCKSLYPMRSYDHKISQKLRPTWTAIRRISRITPVKRFYILRELKIRNLSRKYDSR